MNSSVPAHKEIHRYSGILPMLNPLLGGPRDFFFFLPGSIRSISSLEGSQEEEDDREYYQEEDHGDCRSISELEAGERRSVEVGHNDFGGVPGPAPSHCPDLAEWHRVPDPGQR